jgi:hypothetical protein
MDDDDDDDVMMMMMMVIKYKMHVLVMRVAHTS